MKNISQEKIALLGLGLENQSLLYFLLKKYQKIDLTICDFRDKKIIQKDKPELKKFPNLKWQTGQNFNINLEKFSLLFRSPGWPINCPGIQKAIKNKVVVSSPMQFFIDICPSKNIVAVTGTKGKGTTASLITEILKKSGKKCFLGGNIGIAPLFFVNKIKKGDWIVLELSSFQLEDLSFSPKIAVLTNLFKEHLSPADPKNPNFHKTFKKYFEAKMKVVVGQKKSDYFVVNKNLSTKIKSYKIKSKKIYFSRSKSPSKLIGDFNQENIAAAEQVAKILKINKKNYLETISNFKNLNHRLEWVREINQVNYYDNSFSTTPESTILDLKSFKKNIILLAGGSDKGANFKKLALEIKKRVKFLILFSGKGSERIKLELKKIKYPSKLVYEANSMKEAIIITNQQTEKNDVVLLSTGCASFGIFKNYKERGNLFQEEVNNL